MDRLESDRASGKRAMGWATMGGIENAALANLIQVKKGVGSGSAIDAKLS
jgi:hypothetical protein